MNEQYAVGISLILFFCLSSDKQNSPLNLKIYYVIYSQGTHLTLTAIVLTHICLHAILSLRMG